MMSAPGYSLHVDAGDLYDGKHDRKRQGNRKRDDEARTDAETDEAHDENDGNRLPQRRHELADRLVHDDGLVRDHFRLDSDRQIRGDLRHRFLDVSAERKNVAPSRIEIASPMAGWPSTRNIGCGGSE
jgi:hypothetical protein